MGTPRFYVNEKRVDVNVTTQEKKFMFMTPKGFGLAAAELLRRDDAQMDTAMLNPMR